MHRCHLKEEIFGFNKYPPWSVYQVKRPMHASLIGGDISVMAF